MTISSDNLLQVIPDLLKGPFLLHYSYGMGEPVSLTAGRLCARKVQQQSSQPTRWTSTSAGATIFSMASSIQFIKGVNEPTVPDVKLTRARDGSSGTASFVFKEPSVFEADNELGDITGMFLVDDEGTLSTVDVQAKFLNGKPDRIEAKYIMRSGFEWDRWASQRLFRCSSCAEHACLYSTGKSIDAGGCVLIDNTLALRASCEVLSCVSADSCDSWRGMQRRMTSASQKRR